MRHWLLLSLLALLALQTGCLGPLKSLVRAASSCKVESDPPGAAIRLNGEYIGTAPCRVRYREADKYAFSADLANYHRADQSFKEFPTGVLLRLSPLARPPQDCSLTDLPAGQPAVSVAVLDFQPPDADARQLGTALADYCRQAVQASGRYILVDRENMRSLLTEADFASTAQCDETRCLVDYGRKLRAQKIIHGRLSRVGSACVLTIKMIDVGSAAVAGIQNAKVAGAPGEALDFVAPTTCALLRETLTRPPP
jgi:hypothetical protein